MKFQNPVSYILKLNGSKPGYWNANSIHILCTAISQASSVVGDFLNVSNGGENWRCVYSKIFGIQIFYEFKEFKEFMNVPMLMRFGDVWIKEDFCLALGGGGKK